jgi:carbonic anhydrase/acetyltransferase-like protein (isoleucine patch superfamily)
MTVYRLGKQQPLLDKDTWVSPSAQVMGRVHLEAGCNVWFGAVLRADNEPMHIGAGSNVQDGAVLHSDPGFPLNVGENVTVGHQAMLHGCNIGEGSLIGIGAVVLNGARIGKHCLVAAGALVTEGRSFPDGTLIVGSPAVAKRQLSREQISGLLDSARIYRENALRYRESLVVLS